MTHSGRKTVEHAVQAELELGVGVGFRGFEDAAGEHRVLARREDLADVGADAALPLLFGQPGALLGAPGGLSNWKGPTAATHCAARAWWLRTARTAPCGPRSAWAPPERATWAGR
ncbi:hypothetical protein FHS29_000890 [Saccharothrix tamanrassetensis]|uniref:Uncharacterized protein n=1 Tax=Saccharothrix tamanrassetensis TaxID=1051531 RepID=A0A841CBG1_9PSEU|nr:hypothetical protein [Saccharothrix tamanrassetensis]